MVKNRSLARSISDAGWGESIQQLDYSDRSIICCTIIT
jgi:transposase